MYAQRLGLARSLASNPMGAMHGVGVALAFGSDSPVTPLDPWGSVRAAMWHHNPAHRMSARAAFAAHTRGGWRAVHRDDEGVLGAGRARHVRGLGGPGRADRRAAGTGRRRPGRAAPTLPPVCRRTVLRGTTIYDGATRSRSA